MRGGIEIIRTAPKKVHALIQVSFPPNSTCICTNGSKIFRAKTTNGKWLFGIPEDGEWKLTATDGKNIKEKTVQIRQKGQIEKISLEYVFSLFTEGQGVADGVSVKFGADTAGASVSPAGIIWATTNGVGNQVWFDPKIDVSKYSTLSIELRCDTRNANSDKYTVGIGVGIWEPTGAAQPNDWKASKTGIWDTARNVHKVDISSVSGEVFIKIAAYATTGTIFNVWLEE